MNVALPRIGAELPTTIFGVLEGQSYVYAGYLLTLSALLVLAGALNDYFGRRRMFVYGLLGFGATSILCGLAMNMETLVVFRLLQGATGALLVPGSLALITACFQGEERGRAIGYWSGASAATTILGPVVGGLLVDTISWRMAFFINVPLIALALFAAREVRESRDAEARGQFDWLGSALVAVAVGGLAFGAIYGQQREWRDPLAYVALAAGAVATVAFPPYMRRAPAPLVPLELFRSRNFTITNISTFLIYGALYVNIYYLTLYMQGTLGYSAAAAGVATLPATLLLVFFSSRAGALSARFGARLFMAGGPALMTVGVLLLALVPSDSDAWILGPQAGSSMVPPADYLTHFLPGLVVFGAGLTLMVAPLVTALMASIPLRHSGVGSAINNAISRVGPQLAGAVIFIAITASFYAGLEQRVAGLDTSAPELRQAVSPLNPPKGAEDVPTDVAARLREIRPAAREASTDAFHLAMLVSAVLLAAGAIVNALGIRDQPAPSGAQAAAAPTA